MTEALERILAVTFKQWEYEMTELLTADEIAARLQVNRTSVVRSISKQPDFPPPVRIGSRTLRWPADKFEQWLRRREMRAA